MLTSAVKYIINLGPTVMLPIILTIIGLMFGLGLKRSFKSGITIGIGFVGINLVIGLLTGTGGLGEAAQKMVSNFGLHLSIIDVGWPAAAAIAWASPIAAVMIPIAVLVNLGITSYKVYKCIRC
jgi:galactitol PTS system EIIC component